MKEKRKKIVARVGAMVATLLLVVAMAIPCFAEETSDVTSLEERFLQVNNINEYNPLYHLMLNTPLFDWTSTPYVYQFSFDAERPFGTTDLVTLEGKPNDQLGITVIRGVNLTEPVVLLDTYWETSHTTRNGIKYVYFDLWQQSLGDASLSRVLRIRLSVDATNGSLYTVEFDGADSRLDGDGTAFVVATCSALENNDVLSYANSRGIVASWGTKYGYYNNFSDAYYVGIDKGYDNGYDVGYDRGKNVGYDDGFSQSSLISGVTAIFRAPMELINSVLNFEILGINMAVAVRVLISMAILGMVITVIWKAVK